MPRDTVPRMGTDDEDWQQWADHQLKLMGLEPIDPSRKSGRIDAQDAITLRVAQFMGELDMLRRARAEAHRQWKMWQASADTIRDELKAVRAHDDPMIAALHEGQEKLCQELNTARALLARWLYPEGGVRETAEQMHQLAVETTLELPAELHQAVPHRAELAMAAMAAMLEARDKLRAP